MKKLIQKMAWSLLLVPFVCGSSAFADEPESFQHEITGGTASSLIFSSGSSNFGLGLGYYYFILPDIGLELGYTSDFHYSSANDTSVTKWTNIFGVRYNLPNSDSVTDKFFIDFGLGFNLDRNAPATGTATNETRFVYDVGFGRRFQIARNVSYIPQVSIRSQVGSKVQFILVPVAFSLFF